MTLKQDCIRFLRFDKTFVSRKHEINIVIPRELTNTSKNFSDGGDKEQILKGEMCVRLERWGKSVKIQQKACANLVHSLTVNLVMAFKRSDLLKIVDIICDMVGSPRVWKPGGGCRRQSIGNKCTRSMCNRRSCLRRGVPYIIPMGHRMTLPRRLVVVNSTVACKLKLLV